MTSLDEMISLPTDLQFKLLSNRIPEAVVMAKVFLDSGLTVVKAFPWAFSIKLVFSVRI